MGKKSILLTLLLGILACSPVWAEVQSITLEEALKQKLVTASIQGRGSHYGQCITLNLTNNSRNNLIISLEAGRKLDCVYDSIQNMMVTKSDMLALLPSQKKEFTIYAMCCEMHDRSPSSSSVYNLGSMAETSLVKLACLIEKLGAQDNAGQKAIWVITDGLDPSEISSEDPSVTNALQDFVTNGAIQYYTPERKPGIIYDYSYPNHDGQVFTFEGELEWEMAYNNYVSLYLYDNKGKMIKSIFQDVMYRSGTQSYHYNISDPSIVRGEIYWIRLRQGSKVLKEVAISID